MPSLKKPIPFHLRTHPSRYSYYQMRVSHTQAGPNYPLNLCGHTPWGRGWMVVESSLAPADFKSSQHTGPWPPMPGDLLHCWTWGKDGVHIKVVRRKLSQKDRDEIGKLLDEWKLDPDGNPWEDD